MAKYCPVCSEPVVTAHGDEESDILFIGSSPTETEQKYGRPFVGDVGRIFKQELFKIARIDLAATRQVLLWWHPKPAKKLQADCFMVSLEQVTKEMENKKIIILVGADAVRHFTGHSIEDTNGLDYLDYESGHRFFMLVNPTGIYRSLGEMRFGLEKLKDYMEKYV